MRCRRCFRRNPSPAWRTERSVATSPGSGWFTFEGKDNVVARNHIHDLGQTVSNGRNHDVFTMGVYLDDCDCGDAIVSNVFDRVFPFIAAKFRLGDL